MSESLFSSDWHLVSDRRFVLRSNAQIARQANRDEVEYIVQNRFDGQHFRMSAAAYDIVGRFDGSQTVDQIWRSALERLGDWVPTQKEVLDLLSQLYKAGLVRSDEYPNLEVQREQEKKRSRQLLKSKLKSPLGIKVPLWDPNRFLDRTAWVARVFYSRLGAMLFLGLLAIGTLIGLVQFEAFGRQTSDQLLTAQNLLLMAAVYPVVKGIHEMGHAYAVKRWGGEVHEMGVMMLVFFPVPYVDASSSGMFRSKYPRMVVGAAGILVELGLACIAMIIWAAAEPGLLQALAYNVVILCGLSTLLFNGNPLLRFDAYYVLADHWEEPNLGKKANSQLGYFLKKYLLAIPRASGLRRTPAQNIRLILYSIASFIYRFGVMLVIAVYVATEFGFLGAVLAVMSITFGFLMPLKKVLMSPVQDPEIKPYATRAWWAFLVFVAGLAYLLVGWKAPQTLTVEAIAVPQPSASVRANSTGWVEQVLPAGPVDGGALLVQIEPREQQAQYRRIQVELERADLNLSLAVGDPLATRQAELTQTLLTERAMALKERIDQAPVVAHTHGVWVPVGDELRPGLQVARGQELGWVVQPADMQIEGLISESAAARLTQARSVEVRRLDSMRAIPARLVAQAPRGSKRIDQPLLTVNGGGQIATAPNDAGDELAAQAYVRIWLEAQADWRAFERVQIQFQLPEEPLAFRAYRTLRRNFLSWFNL